MLKYLRTNSHHEPALFNVTEEAYAAELAYWGFMIPKEEPEKKKRKILDRGVDEEIKQKISRSIWFKRVCSDIKEQTLLYLRDKEVDRFYAAYSLQKHACRVDHHWDNQKFVKYQLVHMMDPGQFKGLSQTVSDSYQKPILEHLFMEHMAPSLKNVQFSIRDGSYGDINTITRREKAVDYQYVLVDVSIAF
jgi:hypothetical protein